ncbi:MAG TPA: putative ABC transporter permease [Lapidilactobacillus dextrinicus]|uniref:ABC transporter permease n=2 Tax=Lapidilactobacillus dextrinicus TaxID=51664 RepID=A0A0R2BGN4_9LACO|nr:putative ABC transporter permease [Lapidilactobacillus dextrinicus]KRM78600.1 hypothetical protein FC84_GL000440 [Lapidilactobacillus dextrinicus DSM 20335]QFG47481.1 hypothetical protein LH506_08640 [Lapidilactobacillus dextrinicus]HJE14465.1 putative ABC transporter permease [Lapidilactobacillus dextrinicus]
MNPNTFIEVVLQFFVYGFIGWLWETGLYLVKEHHFVSRGFLIGPIIPIYGFGVLAVLYLLKPWVNNIVLLYISATIVVTALEFLTGYLLEKIFHTKWWNYEKVPLNLGGYVALPVSLFWGICCVLIVEFVQPQVLAWVDWAGATFGLLLPVVLIAIGMFDFGFTLANLQSFRQRMEKLNATIEDRKAKLSTELGEVRTDLQQNWDDVLKDNPKLAARLSNLSFGQRHLLKSFPNMKMKNITSPTTEIKDLVEALRKK